MPNIRIDKMLALAAGLTRSEARYAVQRGLVSVNGTLVRKADEKISDTGSIFYKGVPISHKPFVYIMLNKPLGVVSASRDINDTTVVDLVRDNFPRRELFPAGRLDKISTGFVLLTDDGNFAHDILAPKKHISKTYEIVVDAPLTNQMSEEFEKGVTLADGSVMNSATLQISDEDPYKAVVILHQGVYHQVKRMLGVFDIGVNELHRKAIGDVLLDTSLNGGEYRELTDDELKLLKKGILKT